MYSAIARERTANLPFNLSSLGHMIHGAAAMKTNFDRFVNDASVRIYHKALDINSAVWNKIDQTSSAVSELHMTLPVVDTKTAIVGLGLITVGLITVIGLVGCTSSGIRTNDSVTARICVYDVDRLYEGHPAEEDNADWTTGNRKIQIRNPIVITTTENGKPLEWLKAIRDVPPLIEYAKEKNQKLKEFVKQ